MRTQFVTNEQGQKTAVILSIKDYEKLLADREDAQDVKAYDKAKKRKTSFVPAEDMFKTIEAKRK